MGFDFTGGLALTCFVLLVIAGWACARRTRRHMVHVRTCTRNLDLSAFYYDTFLLAVQRWVLYY